LKIKLKKKNLYFLVSTIAISLVTIGSSWMLLKIGSLDPRLLAKLIQTQDTACSQADITGANNIKDNKVDSYDLNLVLTNWNWQVTPRDTRADLWGSATTIDQKVDIYDISRVLYCWRLETEKKSGTTTCGDGVLNSGEMCDPPYSNQGCNANKICNNSCQCVVTTSNPPPANSPTPGTILPSSNTPTLTIAPSIVVRPSPTTMVANTPTPTPINTTAPTNTPAAATGTCTCSATGCADVCLGIACSNQCTSDRQSVQRQTTQAQCTVSYCTPVVWTAASDACAKDSRCKKITAVNDVKADWSP